METIKELLVPTNICLVLVALGGLGLTSSLTRSLARRVVVASLLVLLTLSSGWTATLLLLPLESAHPPTSLREGNQIVRAIVVLGAYAAPESELPVSSWTNDAGLFRLVEAIHVSEHCHDCRILLSGSTRTVNAMARVLTSLGMPADRIEIDGNSETTAASARSLSNRLRDAPFYLVTSAGHMPRAMLAFRSQGLSPLPAPTDYRVPRDFLSANPLPTPRSLWLSDIAVREYFGILWYRLQGM